MGRVRLLPASPLVSPWCFLSSQLCSLAPAHSYYQLTSSWHDSAWSWLGRGGFLNKESSLGVWYLLTSLRSLRLDLLGAGVRKFSPACRKGLPYGGSLALEHGELAKGGGLLAPFCCCNKTVLSIPLLDSLEVPNPKLSSPANG